MARQPNPIKLGPFAGINNTKEDDSIVYAPKQKDPIFLREATNVDLSPDGWISKRPGKTKLLTFTDAHSGAYVNGMFLVVDNGTLKLVHPGTSSSDASTETLKTGLTNNEMSYAEAGGQVYFCNGTDTGRIKSGVATYWGLMPPAPPTLTATTGNLPAGTYMVALTCEGSDGIEGGSRKASQVTLSSTGGITATLTADPNAAYVNIYVTDTNGKTLFWVDRVASTETSYTIVNRAQSTDTLDRMHMYPPPSGASIVRSFKGYLLVVAGSALYWSQPLAYHLFKKSTDMQMFSSTPVLVEPVADGFYVGETDRMWWVAGDDPDSWRPTQVDDRHISSGMALRIPGRKIPSLQTSAMVCVWASADGPVAGLPGGRLVHLTEDNVAMDANTKASLLYKEEGGLAQVLMQLRNRHATSRFGASDRATATVIKSGLS